MNLSQMIWILILNTSLLTAATQRVVSPVKAVALDSTHSKGMAGVKVQLMVKRNLLTSYEEIGTGITDHNGAFIFPEYRGEKFNWLGLIFSWQPAHAPERHLLFELKLEKASKNEKGQVMDPKTPYASYVLDGVYTSQCLNLFELKQNESLLEVVLHVPASYSDCENPARDFTDLAQIGKRELNKGNLNYFKFDKDRQMGAQFYQNMKNTPENQPLNDPMVVNYVNQMVQRLTKASDMPDLQYTVTVLDADVMNAFALPGGFIFVYRGLMEQTESEAELAGVLAHEIAHVTSRHGTEGVTSAINKMLLATTLGEVAAHNMKGEDQWLIELAKVAIFAGTQFWVMGGTRKREAEADYLGVQYAWKAGYDPNGIASLFARWATQRDSKQTRLDQFFSDHPNDLNRVEDVQNTIGYFFPPYSKTYSDSTDYRKVKARLAQLPPPKASGQAAANSLFSSFKQANEKVIFDTMQGYFLEEQKN